MAAAMKAHEKAMLRGIGEVMREHLARIAAELKAQAERIEVLEARSLPEAYRGVFDLEARYTGGQLVTHQGGLWMALRDVQGEKPGPSPAFRLILKAGSR